MKINEYLSGKKYLKRQEELLLNMCPERQLKHCCPVPWQGACCVQQQLLQEGSSSSSDPPLEGTAWEREKEKESSLAFYDLFACLFLSITW